MAILDPDGSQFPPWREYRFRTWQLEAWFDGQKRTLVPNVDFPADMPFKNLKRRLEEAASKRSGSARVWREPDDRVGVLLTIDWEKWNQTKD